MQNLLNLKGNYQGISAEEAETQLRMYGYNTLSKLEEDGKGFRAASVFLSPRFILMVINAVLMFLNSKPSLGIVLLLLSAVYAATEIVRGIKCDEKLHSLKRLAGIKFRVVRGGEITLLRKEYIVPDDIIILQEGESVPADAHLLEVSDVTADESLFTGDNTPSVKIAGADGKNELKQSCIYKGTRILSGYLAARVIATGVDTRQHKLLKEESEEIYYSSIESFINKITPVFVISAIVFTTAVWLFNFISYDSDAGSVIDTIAAPMLTALSFGLCFLPAEVSAAVRMYYVHGALKLAGNNCVVKDISVLENLGALTAVCIDKAGIITKSRIELAEEYTKNPEMLTNISLLACGAKPSSAVDQAIILGATFKHIDIKELHKNELITAFPFSENNKLGGNLWRINGAKLFCVKGSPENIFNICDMPPEQLYKMQKKQLQYSKQGHQVIAVAYSRIPDERENPETIFDVSFTFAGLLAFTNQTRDSIPMAVRGCYRAGVDVIMLTGDSVDTALAIGKKIGLKSGRAVTGEQLKRSMENNEKIDLTDVNIFARINSEQKLEIVRLLQERGEIVGITGENATDVEVLKHADVGIIRAVNAAGSAQEACGLIMNDDKFAGIVDVLREARQIHRNIKRVIGVSVSALLAQLLFAVFNIITSGEFLLAAPVTSLLAAVIVPACLMLFIGNRADAKSMLYSSGFIGRGKLDKRFLLKAAYQGLALFAAMLIIYFVMPGGGFGEARRAGLLTVMVSGILTASWVVMSDKPLIGTFRGKNTPLTITGILFILLLFVIYIPFINSLFLLSSLEPLILFLALILGFVSQLPFDLIKFKNGEKKK